MACHDEGGIDRRDIVIFGFCLALTVAGGLLQLTGFQPTYWGSILALAAASIGGAVITAKSVRALLHGAFGVDILASIAIWISVLVGEYLAAAIVVIMLNGGELVEDYASERSSKAIEKLMRSAPLTARVLRNWQEVEVDLEEVTVGDIVIVRPGEKIPVDGVVMKGGGLVNQASITGESSPSEKSVGSQVFGNTLLEDGAFDIRVTKAHGETVFAQIVKQVEEAQSRKAPVERVADRYARWFAPIILSIATVTWLVTGNILTTAAVLVISCPCSLTLATPIAVVAGLDNSARNGVLIRGGTSLEEVGRCDIVIIDKTGTVTLGKPEVVDIKALGGRGAEDVLRLAGTAEQRSEHSLAKAILDKARELGIPLEDPDEFHVKPGYGVVTELDGHRILVGNLKLMREYGIEADEELTSYVDAESVLGRTAVLVTEDSRVVGIISIADTLRKGVKNSVSDMRRAGARKVIMLTGDKPQAAKEVARQAGIDDVYGDLLPGDKVKHIEDYRKRGRRVIAVGDGINDAPALATANVGIAMGVAGTDVAMETAGIVLMTDDLSKVARTMRLGRRVLSIVKLNVVFALCVNILGLLLSALGFVTPVMASIIHEGNALIVVFNSLRLVGQR